MLEEPAPAFNEAFVACCQRAGLPSEFWQPIVEHSGINEAAEHDDVCRQLLSTTSALTREHVQAVLKQVAAC